MLFQVGHSRLRSYFSTNLGAIKREEHPYGRTDFQSLIHNFKRLNQTPVIRQNMRRGDV